jgi:hypothetical protein
MGWRAARSQASPQRSVTTAHDSPVDTQDHGDSDDLVDHEQRNPHFKGYPRRLTPIDAPVGVGAFVCQD